MSKKRKHAKRWLSLPVEEFVTGLGSYLSHRSFVDKIENSGSTFLPFRTPPPPPAPYPAAFYSAEEWLRSKRDQLLDVIVREFDYGSKRNTYAHKSQLRLVKDLARAIKPVCKSPYYVDPTLIATTLVKIGLDDFCSGYNPRKTESDDWTLEKALGLDPLKANKLTDKARKLVLAGQWKKAVPLLESALQCCPLHFIALNDLTDIYGRYYPRCKKGLEYARKLWRQSNLSGHREPEVLDTMGWAGFRHGGKVKVVEKVLTDAERSMKPGESGYITVAYHLMAVLVARKKYAAASDLFKQFVDLPSTTSIDSESLRAAKRLSRGLS